MSISKLVTWILTIPLALFTRWITKDYCNKCGETLRYTGYEHIFRCDKCGEEKR